MSETGEKYSSDEQRAYDDEAPICRDYQRGLCARGSRCKFRHPEGAGPKVADATEHNIEFCHDYQNPGGCHRINCRFFHATKQEEKIFLDTGRLPSRVSSGGGNMQETPGERPVCKDFMYDKCNRAHCRYRHITQSEYDFEQMVKEQKQLSRVVGQMAGIMEAGQQYGGGYDDVSELARRKRVRTDYYDDDFAIPQGPRSFMAGRATSGFGGMEEMAVPAARARGFATESAMDMDVRREAGSSSRQKALEEENFKLREKVRDLEKQISYLSAANEVLLEQNARIRVSSGTIQTAPMSVAAEQQQVAQQVVAAGAAMSVAAPAMTMQHTSMPVRTSAAGMMSSDGLVSYPVISQGHM